MCRLTATVVARTLTVGCWFSHKSRSTVSDEASFLFQSIIIIIIIIITDELLVMCFFMHVKTFLWC